MIEGLPDCYVDGSGDSNGSFLGGRGKWQLESMGANHGLTLEIASGGTLHPGLYHGSSILIKGSAAPFTLELVIGDPDSGESISYERQDG